jgi:hypothetical protein
VKTVPPLLKAGVAVASDPVTAALVKWMIAVEPEITTSTPAASIGGAADPAGAVVGGLVVAGFVLEGTVVRDECPAVLEVEPCEAAVGADEQPASTVAMTSTAGRGATTRKRPIVELHRLGIGLSMVCEWVVMVRRWLRRMASRSGSMS